MEIAQVVPSESNKRKRETMSPADGSDDNDDKLEVKHGGGEGKSSLSFEIVVEEENKGEQVNIDEVDFCEVYSLTKIKIDTSVWEFAREAVAIYNRQAGNDEDKMELLDVKEALSEVLPLMTYHINFDAKWIAKDGKETTTTTCQAVVYLKRDDSVEVDSFKFGSPGNQQGNDTQQWCQENKCFCALGFLNDSEESEDEGPSNYWYVSRYDSSLDEVEDEKMKPESPEQPPLASIVEETDLEYQVGTQN